MEITGLRSTNGLEFPSVISLAVNQDGFRKLCLRRNDWWRSISQRLINYLGASGPNPRLALRQRRGPETHPCDGDGSLITGGVSRSSRWLILDQFRCCWQFPQEQYTFRGLAS